jgi:hypothetical protein
MKSEVPVYVKQFKISGQSYLQDLVKKGWVLANGVGSIVVAIHIIYGPWNVIAACQEARRAYEGGALCQKHAGKSEKVSFWLY